MSQDANASTSIDDTNLIQALRDFEIANARVIDLTGRLASASRELISVKSELLAAQARIAKYVAAESALQDQEAVLQDRLVEIDVRLAELNAIRSSSAYLLARSLGDVKNRALGKR